MCLKSNTKKWLSVIGTGNVLIEAVAEFDNEVDALKYEDELILKYNTITNGYNKCRSGLIFLENSEEYQRKYQKVYRKEYQRTEWYKEYQRKWHRKYSKTDKCREYQRNYQKVYQCTDGYKEYRRKWQRDYYHAKKLGISVDEYRKLKQNKKQAIQLNLNF